MNNRLSMSRSELMEFLGGQRGDHLDDIGVIALHSPETAYLIRLTSGYVHSYDGLSSPDQSLSIQMRELIALCQLCAKSEEGLAAFHLQRLYRLGVTDNVLIEAAESISPIVGWSTVFMVARLVRAGKSGRPAPAEPVAFPEMAMGRSSLTKREDSLFDDESWAYVASIDQGLADRAGSYADRCRRAHFVEDASTVLGPGVRELIAIPALCARGEEERATRHILRAYDYGLNRHQVLEAISCVLPMTGVLTVQIGARAMMAADREASMKVECATAHRTSEA